jgi:hypothetical protein
MIAMRQLRLLSNRAGHGDAMRVRRWPADVWLPLALDAVRAAHAAHCAAVAFRDNPAFKDVARFLARRTDMLLQLLVSLITENRCEERLRQLTSAEALESMKQAEEQLHRRVKSLLAAAGLKRPLARLLELESPIGQASLAQLQLALMERNGAPAA